MSLILIVTVAVMMILALDVAMSRIMSRDRMDGCKLFERDGSPTPTNQPINQPTSQINTPTNRYIKQSITTLTRERERSWSQLLAAVHSFASSCRFTASLSHNSEPRETLTYASFTQHLKRVVARRTVSQCCAVSLCGRWTGFELAHGRSGTTRLDPSSESSDHSSIRSFAASDHGLTRGHQGTAIRRSLCCSH